MRLNWASWIYGLFAALIVGGTSAITAGFVAPALAPGQFNYSGDAGWTTLKLMSIMFLVNGVIGAAAYLQKSPLPAIETSVAVTTQEGTPPKITTTVTTNQPPSQTPAPEVPKP
jgi:hypothetical protein